MVVKLPSAHLLFMKQEFTFVKVLIATNKCHVKKR